MFNKKTGRSTSGKCKQCYAEASALKRGGRKIPYRANINEEETKEIIRLYVDERLGSICIGSHFNRSDEAILKVLKRNSIPIRSALEVQEIIKSRYGLAPEQQKARSKRHNLAQRVKDKEKWRAVVFDMLKDKQCHDCGCCDWTILQFDHVDPTQKEFNMHDMVGKSPTRIRKEISKCEVVCPNCHAKRTAKMFGSWRLSYAS